ncbi:hypothetical protein HMPREF1863_00208 [Aedoeadaptatus coxii]|uniref:Uncharacterized protein n=1 Tax=Aedoeadaptatus coxii TaxID=755172 RepID=A0A134AKF5_9FIRM|nr:hypothetical protein HMPREF1863_00208 [Peptoniphilus coxii]
MCRIRIRILKGKRINAKEYLKVYPLNIWFYSGILILLIGVAGILYERIKK